MTYQTILQTIQDSIGGNTTDEERDMREIFDRYHNQEHWKYPFMAEVEDGWTAEMLKAGIIFFHGCEFVQVGNTIGSTGYAAW